MELIDRFSRRIKLTEERWNHIAETHPELKDMLMDLKGALEAPELIKRSVYNEKVVLFYRYYGHIYEGKYMCVVVSMEKKLKFFFDILNFEKRFEHKARSETLPITAIFGQIEELEAEG